MKKISAKKLIGDLNDKEKEEEEINVSINEILLLNKSSGLPIFSRVYKKTSGKDPTLIAGLMAAIVQFGEMIGNNMELNDIGTREGTRIFVRSQKDLVCLLTVGNLPIDISSGKFLDIVNELSSRIFETISMMMSIPVYESESPLDSVNIVVSDTTLDGPNMSIFPELGQIIDNVVLETTTLFYEYREEEDLDLDAMVEKELFEMEETNSTYLKSEYSGTTQEIKKKKVSELRNFFSIFSKFSETKR